MFIRSERLILRPGWPEDSDELQAAIRDGAASPVDGAERLIDPLQERAPSERLLPRFVITLPSAEGARLIGSVGLYADGAGPSLGVWIAPGRRGQGYASEAARAVLGLARTLGHRRIAAPQAAGSPAFARVLGKLGFRCDGAARAGELVLTLGQCADCDDDPAGVTRAA